MVDENISVAFEGELNEDSEADGEKKVNRKMNGDNVEENSDE